MRERLPSHWLWIFAAAVICLAAEVTYAQVRFPGDSPRRLVPGVVASYSPARTFTFSGHRHGSYWGSYRPSRHFSYGYHRSIYGGPVYGGVYFNGYDYGGYRYPRKFYGAGNCSGCGFYGSACVCRGPIYYPPVVVDPSKLYGPQALLRFYGVGNTSNAQPAQTRAPILPPAPRVAARPANAGARARAWRFVDYGDRHFKAGRYREALSRYKKAIASVGEIDAAHFRSGFAYLALGNFERSAQAMRRGLKLNPDWPESQFVVEDLFDDAAQRAVLRSLSAQLKKLPNDANARLLAGIMFHFDGQPAMAANQFRRAVDVAGDDAVAGLFLPKPQEDEPLLPAGE